MGNRLKVLNFGFRSGLASLLLSISGCLLPQDDEPLPDLPPQKNSPLRIVNSQPPQVNTTFVVPVGGQPCPKQNEAFGVGVFDHERGTIRAFWFVQGSAAPFFSRLPRESSFNVTRTVPAPDGVTQALSNQVGKKNVQVEVWVTDGDFTGVNLEVTYQAPEDVGFDGVEDCRRSTTPPDNCDSAYKVSHLWLVSVEQCSP